MHKCSKMPRKRFTHRTLNNANLTRCQPVKARRQTVSPLPYVDQRLKHGSTDQLILRIHSRRHCQTLRLTVLHNLLRMRRLALPLPHQSVQQQHCHHNQSDLHHHHDRRHHRQCHQCRCFQKYVKFLIGGIIDARKMNILSDGSFQPRRTCCMPSDGCLGRTWSKTTDCVEVSML